MSSDLPEARKTDDSVLESAERRDLANLVAASLPERDAEAWLGQVVIEVQRASDRAVAWAESQAAAILAEASSEADRIRTQGQRRAQLMARLQAVAQRPALKNGDAARPSHASVPAKLPPARVRWPAVESPITGVPLTKPAATNPHPPTPPTAVAEGTNWHCPVAPPPPLAQVRPQEAVTRSPGLTRSVLAPPTGRPAPLPPTVPEVFTPTAEPPAAEPPPAEPPAPEPPAHGRSTAPPAPAGPPSADVVVHDHAAARSPDNAPDPEPPAVAGAPKPAAPKKPAYRRLVAVLLAIVVVAAGFIVFEDYGTKAEESRAQQRLTHAFTTRGDARSEGVLGLLTVPELGLRNTAVIDGASRQTLQEGPAHDTSSQYPGQQGVVVIIGHHHSYGAPFGRLGRLRVGDVVTLRTNSGLLIYRVTRNPQALTSHPGAPFVLPSGPEVQASGGNPLHASQALVLATSQGTGSSPLLVVVATLYQSTIGNPPPPRASVSAVLRAIPGDRISLLWAALWLLLLVGCLRLPRLRHRKFPPVAAYTVAACATVLVTYQLYIAIDRVLPGTS